MIIVSKTIRHFIEEKYKSPNRSIESIKIGNISGLAEGKGISKPKEKISIESKISGFEQHIRSVLQKSGKKE